jgi:hypothetical protein
MSLRQFEIAEIKRHKQLAEDALKKLSDIKVRSWNKAWNLNRSGRKQALKAQRAANHATDNDFQATTTLVTGSRLGNCWERGTMFAYFASLNISDLGNTTHLSRVEDTGWDYVWAVLTTATLAQGQTYTLAQFGTSGVILDGWTEDWWFPQRTGALMRVQVERS